MKMIYYTTLYYSLLLFTTLYYSLLLFTKWQTALRTQRSDQKGTNGEIYIPSE